MSFYSLYCELEQKFFCRVQEHREKAGLSSDQEIFVPMSFFPSVPDGHGGVSAVFIGMYPSQNWLSESQPDKRLRESSKKIASGFRIALSTEWDVVFHLAVRRCLLRDGETYYVTDMSKGAMQTRDEKRTRDWDDWYELLQDEIRLVLGGDRSPMAHVIPVGQAVEEFLRDRKRNFGGWLEKEDLGRLAPRVVHWGWAAWEANRSRRRRQNAPNSTFVRNHGREIDQLADQLLKEVDAGSWWQTHLNDNLARIAADPWTAWWCERLFSRYQEEFAKVLEEEGRRQASAPPSDTSEDPIPSRTQRFISALQELPDTATLDDIEGRFLTLMGVERELEEVDAGRVIPHEELEVGFSNFELEDDLDEEEDGYEEEEDEDEDEEERVETTYGLWADLDFENGEDEEDEE